MRNEGRQGYLFCLRGFRELKKFRSARGDFPAAVVESILICGGRNENHFRGIFRVVKKFVGTPFFAVRVVRSFQIFGRSENLDFVFSAPQVQMHRHSTQKKIRALIFVRDAGNRNPFISCAGRSARNVISIFVLEQNSAADLIYVKRIFRTINYQFPRIVPNVLSVQSENRNKKNRGECNLFQWHGELNPTTKNNCKQVFDLRCKLVNAMQVNECDASAGETRCFRATRSRQLLFLHTCVAGLAPCLPSFALQNSQDWCQPRFLRLVECGQGIFRNKFVRAVCRQGIWRKKFVHAVLRQGIWRRNSSARLMGTFPLLNGNVPKFSTTKKVSTFELLKKRFCSEAKNRS